ncbi:MAG TPA: catalase, partial [Haloferula sp.]
MATRKTKNPAAPSRSKASSAKAPLSSEVIGSVLGTVSAPSSVQPDPKSPLLVSAAGKKLGAQKAAGQALAAAQPENPLKSREFGLEDGHRPPEGSPLHADDPLATASTVSEGNATDKAGAAAAAGFNPANATLERHRVDSAGQPITTNMGVALGNNQASLKAGLRGPTLMEDFILREKITHFDHERIPERIVHARGSGAHGYFECYKPLTKLTRAAPFAKAGKRTPVFVRFSTVVGERGSTDLARDVRGFAVKFYTEEGNWDIVGNNIPVFFIQDAMKFP